MKNIYYGKLIDNRTLTQWRMLKIVAASLFVFGAFSSCIGDDPFVVSDNQEDFTDIKRKFLSRSGIIGCPYEGKFK